MAYHKSKALLSYFLATLTILGWWYFAFLTSTSPQPHTTTKISQNNTPPFTSLTPLKRELLQKALAGDIALMTRLIADWDVDAQILELAGQASVKRIDRYAYLRSQLLGRHLVDGNPEQIKALRSQARLQCIYDDIGVPLQLTNKPQRFLPQTYVAASFLLALADAEQIVALPKGLRSHIHLFPDSLTKNIPVDLDQFNTESLYLAHPEVAFVAHYSHPLLVDTLKNQGTQLFTIKKIDTVPEIRDALMRVGQIIDRSLEAEMLALFIDSAMLAIDNRLVALQANREPINLLFVNYHSQYSVPAMHTLTGQLLQRMGVTPLLASAKSAREWNTPIDQESIVKANPDYLIIATRQRDKLMAHINNDPAFATLSALQKQRISLVDDVVQEFPAQYIVLAYYDLYHALSSP